MRRHTLKIISALLVLLVIIMSCAVPAGAISFSNKVDVKSESALVVSMDSGQTVYEKDPDSKRYPASTTKIMTYIVAVENIDDIKNTRVEIKKNVLDKLKNTDSSTADLSSFIGKKVKVIDLLYGMMVPSGNDAALVLADYVGEGDVSKFVDMMNDKAEELECENTHFTNPDGLHDPDHYTTARDLYLISKYALTLPYFEQISNTTEYTIEGAEDPLITTNYLIDEDRGGDYYYTYAKGIKTGTTNEAGRCLVTTASADGHTYMAVLLGAPLNEVKKSNGEEGEKAQGEEAEEAEEADGSEEDGEVYYTFSDAADLFRWALVDLEMQTIKSADTPVCERKLKLAWGKDKITLVPAKNLNAIMPKDLKPNEIEIETDVPDEIKAPLYTDKAVGTASVYYIQEGKEKQLVATVDLVPAEQVDMSGILAVLDVIGTIFKSYWFLVIIGIIILLFIIYVIAAKIHRAHLKRNRKVKRYRNF